MGQLSVFLIFIFSLFSYAQNLDWSPDHRPSFRPRMFEKEIFLQPLEKDVDSSVGVRIASHNVEEFATSLQNVLQTRGESALKNSKIYMLGVEMGQEAEFQKRYQEILNQEPFKTLNVKIVVLSVPPKKIFEMSSRIAGNVLKNFQYFLPSLKRDYQTPTWGEVTSGFNSNLAIEFFTISYLFSELPTTDASLAAITHATLIASMTIFTKSLYNWIGRPGTSNKAMFIKQSLLSLPYILNFNIFGNFSKITSYVQTNGFEAAMAQFPHELATFTSTQGFTLFLQTLFYYSVMSKGVRNWANNQVGSENARVARIMANYNAFPFLALDAIFLAMASTNANSFLNLGYFNINYGHLALAGLTVLGSSFWMYPKLLDPTIRWYQAYEKLKYKYFLKPVTCASYFR